MGNLQNAITEVHAQWANTERQIQDAIAAVKALPTGADKDELISQLVSDLNVDPAVFFKPLPASKRTKAEWRLEAEFQKRSADKWKAAGRSDKAKECRNAAKQAEERAKIADW